MAFSTLLEPGVRNRWIALFMTVAAVLAGCTGSDGVQTLPSEVSAPETAAAPPESANQGDTTTASPEAAAELSQEVIRVSAGIDAAYSPMFVAAEQGLFEAEGVNVEVVQFAQGGEGVDALLAGEIQMAGSGDATNMSKSTRGPIAALAIFQESGEYVKLVVREGIAGAQAIARLGVVPGSISEYSASVLFDSERIDPASVEIIQAGPPELPALLEAGDIDGFILWEPWPTQAAEFGATALSGTGDFGYSYQQWLVANPEWLDTHQAEAQAVVRAIAQACELIESDVQTAIESTLARTDIPEETVQLAVDQIDFAVRDFSNQDLVNYEGIRDFQVEREIVETPADLDTLLLRGFYTPE